MSNDILTSLLSEYEQKKNMAELRYEHNKNELYKNFPRLQEIEEELNSTAIAETKNILLGNKNSLKNLHKKLEILKNEKNKIIEENKINEEFLHPIYEC